MTIITLGTHQIRVPRYVRVADDVPHRRERIGHNDMIEITKGWSIDLDFEEPDITITLTTFGD